MINGMTGYGSGDLIYSKVRGSVEIRSVNHRYLDIVCYLPSGFSSVEDKIRQIVNKRFERGRITVSLKINEKPNATISFNKSVVREYLKYANLLKREFNLDEKLAVCDLIRLPGVIDVREVTIEAEEIWTELQKAIDTAVLSMANMRKREGASLARDINKLLRRMLLQINRIRVRGNKILKEKRKKLIAEEFSSLQKGNDVNEEMARLTHHIEEFRILLNSHQAVGKKMDFIAQEMQRETNTIGSKLQDSLVVNDVIALKSEIEKIREQSQNVE